MIESFTYIKYECKLKLTIDAEQKELFIQHSLPFEESNIHAFNILKSKVMTINKQHTHSRVVIQCVCGYVILFPYNLGNNT